MKLSLTIATLATLLLSASVQAKKMKSSRRGGSNKGGPDTYFALMSAAQEVPGCMSSALGNAIATVQDDEFCIRLSYDGLSGPELSSHVHGPAAIGETGLVIFTLDTSTQKTQCFGGLTSKEMKDLDDDLWYFNVHSEACPGGEIRGQILTL
jgi:hypothetical protein